MRLLDWSRFTPVKFEYDSEADELYAHGITLGEAVDCFYSRYQIRRNKSSRNSYQLIGRTRGGRRLKIIFLLKPGGVVRIITGWPI